RGVMGLIRAWISIWGLDLSGRAVILIGGGLFLIAKSTREIHLKLEEGEERVGRAAASFGGVLLQILALDIVFSFDSVITAVGMVDHIGVMIATVMIAVAAMMLFAG